MTPQWGYFAQVLLEQPLNCREDFKPGTGLNVNLGLRDTANTALVPQVQINARFEKRERGAEADIKNSGASLV